MTRQEAFAELKAGWIRQEEIYRTERCRNQFIRKMNRRQARWEKNRVRFDCGFDGKHIWGC